MAKSKNRWDVIYETVDEKNKKLIPHFAAQNVDWKTALMVKRNNKFIAMEIRPTLRALDLWESARFTSIFLASGLSCSQAVTQPARKPVTQVR